MSISDSSSSGEEENEEYERFHHLRLSLIGRRLAEGASSRRQTTSRRHIDRERVECNRRLMRDYFDPNPVYNARIFRRRYRMQPRLFHRIMGDIVRFDPPSSDIDTQALHKISSSFGRQLGPLLPVIFLF
ncbi:unnamed protein product [Linum trigynum]|uniref:Uncharacterized protein n=1 Tax=Linum trigynum TaxID=586398 RepID=A0AAV2G3H7_9ROSI